MSAVEEIWKDIPGFEGRYQASTFGNIRTLDRVCSNGGNGTYKRKGALRKLTLNNNYSGVMCGYLHRLSGTLILIK